MHSPGFAVMCRTRPMDSALSLTHKLAVLIFIENEQGEQLLIKRKKAPNFGNWSPIGGKVETMQRESPFECAGRETREETGLETRTSDFHLFAMIAEKAYEGESHWLLFLFRCRKPIEALPPNIDEGDFAFYPRSQVETLSIPDTDRQALWDIWDRHRDGFVALRVDCSDGLRLKIDVEEALPCRGA